MPLDTLLSTEKTTCRTLVNLGGSLPNNEMRNGSAVHKLHTRRFLLSTSRNVLFVRPPLKDGLTETRPRSDLPPSHAFSFLSRLFSAKTTETESGISSRAPTTNDIFMLQLFRVVALGALHMHIQYACNQSRATLLALLFAKTK